MTKCWIILKIDILKLIIEESPNSWFFTAAYCLNWHLSCFVFVWSFVIMGEYICFHCGFSREYIDSHPSYVYVWTARLDEHRVFVGLLVTCHLGENHTVKYLVSHLSILFDSMYDRNQVNLDCILDVPPLKMLWIKHFVCKYTKSGSEFIVLLVLSWEIRMRTYSYGLMGCYLTWLWSHQLSLTECFCTLLEVLY